jgi:hypothetical protein
MVTLIRHNNQSLLMPIRPSPDNRFCSTCGSHETYIQKPKNSRPYPDWRKDKEGKTVCKKCWNKIVWNPIWNTSIEHEAYDKRKFTYKGKPIILPYHVKKGVCSKCGHKGITNLHHFAEYHDDDPTMDTIELCRVCHTKETWERGQYNTERYRARIIIRNPITKKLAGSMSGSAKI